MRKKTSKKATKISVITPPTVVEVTDAEMAFPAQVIGKFLPDWDAIPAGFKERNDPWSACADRLFFQGTGGFNFYAKDGVSAEKAYRMVAACLGSYEPKHQHKIAGVAYLLATFFEKVEPIQKEAS